MSRWRATKAPSRKSQIWILAQAGARIRRVFQTRRAARVDRPTVSAQVAKERASNAGICQELNSGVLGVSEVKEPGVPVGARL